MYSYNLKKFQNINIVAVNASLGGYGYSQAQMEAIDRLGSVGIILVAAAGNDDNNNDSRPIYPANYDLDSIVSVAATNYSGNIAAFSNYGVQTVDIAAPGEDILSTWNPVIPPEHINDCAGTDLEKYCMISGTSMAAPMVTGALGLLYSQRGHLSYNRLLEHLYNYSYYHPYYTNWVRTGRLLNLYTMLNAPALPDQCPADPNKVEPGLCGCGTPDSYLDSDSDGSINCQEQCPTDVNKTSPGVCGCGVSDADLTQNGISDCNDPNLLGLRPKAPRISAGKKSLTVNMSRKDGARYAIRIQQISPDGRHKTKAAYYDSGTSARGTVRGLKSKWGANASYYYYLGWNSTNWSRESKRVMVKIK